MILWLWKNYFLSEYPWTFQNNSFLTIFRTIILYKILFRLKEKNIIACNWRKFQASNILYNKAFLNIPMENNMNHLFQFSELRQGTIHFRFWLLPIMYLPQVSEEEAGNVSVSFYFKESVILPPFTGYHSYFMIDEIWFVMRWNKMI